MNIERLKDIDTTVELLRQLCNMELKSYEIMIGRLSPKEVITVCIKHDCRDINIQDKSVIQIVYEVVDTILKMTSQSFEHLVCDCGNTSSSDGFNPSNASGEIIEPTADNGWNGLYVCNRCGKLHNQKDYILRH